MKKLSALWLCLVFLLTACNTLPSSSSNSTSSSSSLPFPASPSSISQAVPSSSSEEVQILHEVIRVIDGDTLEIDYHGASEKVRLLLVDAPESVHPDASRNVPQGTLAAEFTRQLLEGKQIALEFDVQERDHYGRLLAYVYLDNILVNQLLLEEGHAVVSVFPPNVKYVDQFRQAETLAQNNQKGLWNQPASSEVILSPSEPASSALVTPVADNLVWIPRTGEKYHSHAGCSNMKNPSQVPLEQAVSQGFGRCKKCW